MSKGNKVGNVFDSFLYGNIKTAEDLKKELPIPYVLSMLGVPIHGSGKKQRILCYYHDDTHPSALIYPDNIYCWTCKTGFDIINVVRKEQGVGFPEAVDWLRKLAGDESQVVRKPQRSPSQTESSYEGPLPSEWLRSTNPLTAESLAYLSGRGITPETSRRCGLRSDKSGGGERITIPYWRGQPCISEIDIVQYRAISSDVAKGDRFRGKTGYNRPSVLNVHAVNPYLVIILFGTFDAIYALQDGLPAVSVNGISQFYGKDGDIERIRKLMEGVENIIVVPDNNLVEYVPAQKLANVLGGSLRYFPEDFDGDDYTDWRQSGRTAAEFMEVVIKMGRYILTESEVRSRELMDAFVKGDVKLVDELSLAFSHYISEGERAPSTNPDQHYAAVTAVLKHELAVAYSVGNFDVSVLTNDQWALYANGLVRADTVTLIRTNLRVYAKIIADSIHSRMGGF